MYELRVTWGNLFPNSKLYSLDYKVRQIDSNWPKSDVEIMADKFGSGPSSNFVSTPVSNIHVNPNIIKARYFL